MRVTLDLTELVARGALTSAEAEKLKVLAAGDAGSLGANILLAFGAVAVTLGIGALLPHPLTATALGLLLFIVGLTLSPDKRAQVVAICPDLHDHRGDRRLGRTSFLSDGSIAIASGSRARRSRPQRLPPAPACSLRSPSWR